MQVQVAGAVMAAAAAACVGIAAAAAAALQRMSRSRVFTSGSKMMMHSETTEPRSGVQCTHSLRECDAFYVEIRTREARDNTAVNLVSLVVRALAGAWERKGRRDVALEVAPCNLLSSEKPVTFMSVRMRSVVDDAPVACTGVWLGNVISRVLDSDLCSKSLVNVDVQPLLVRAAVVQRQILACQEHFALEVLGKGPPDPCKKGTAALWRWEPKSAALRIEAVDAHDDDAETPVRVLAIAKVREENAKAKTLASTTTTSDDKESKKDKLDSVLATLSPSAAAAVRRRIAERDGLVVGSAERAKVQAWLDHVARLPSSTSSDKAAAAQVDMSTKLQEAAEKLDAVVHGLEDAKAAVLQIVGQTLRAPDAPVRALGLCGPPGCGKTSLAVRGIGVALNDRPVRVIGLGGAKDSSVLLGHDYTYSGSRPGRVVDAVCSAGVSNCIIVFDELDKLSDSAQGKEVASVLMSIVDPAQNKAFEDTYLLGVPIDLSRVVFVFTFNDASLIDPILLDRLHIVHVKELSAAEKKKVVRERMLPSIAESLGLKNATMDDDCVVQLLSRLDGGSLRGAEKALERALLNANIRTIREKHVFDGATPLRIESVDLPPNPSASAPRNAFNSMYA